MAPGIDGRKRLNHVVWPSGPEDQRHCAFVKGRRSSTEVIAGLLAGVGPDDNGGVVDLLPGDVLVTIPCN